ncbi:YbaN family protein [Aliikangiella coralliicola]|uniref:YbaN family protein n=1 Tax=Aliikangiella coralliicola TaxID=2592383 RepID=UPI00143DCE31|nr:YbaN family protein [Aliikangiella coralliicola]
MIGQQKGVVKYLLILAGIFFVALGVIGIVVPGLPTTIFLIIAAGCFAKSSPCLHGWLMSHRWFGPIIHHWNETRSIPKKAKFIALSAMLVACIYTTVVLDSLVLKLIIFTVMLFPAIFVYRLPISEDIEQSNPTPNAIETKKTN